MSKAKFYIYRNLRTKGFSIKFKGRVIRRIDSFYAENVCFKVSERGRFKVIEEKQKNVHAYAVAFLYLFDYEAKVSMKDFAKLSIDQLNEIKYNPYKNSSFICNDKPIFWADKVKFHNGKCYTYSKSF